MVDVLGGQNVSLKHGTLYMFDFQKVFSEVFPLQACEMTAFNVIGLFHLFNLFQIF